MKKSCYLLSLMLFLSVAVFGQTQSEGFSNDLKEYAEKRVAGEDSAFSLLRINDVYKQGDDAAQSNYREAIKQAVATSLRANENRQALELINLYDFLVPESTNRAPELYLIEVQSIADKTIRFASKNQLQNWKHWDVVRRCCSD